MQIINSKKKKKKKNYFSIFYFIFFYKYFELFDNKEKPIVGENLVKSLQSIETLKFLKLKNMSLLEDKDVSQIVSSHSFISSIQLFNCPLLTSNVFASFASLENLKCLKISSCEKLFENQHPLKSDFLCELRLENQKQIKEIVLNSLESLPNLNFLLINSCEGIKEKDIQKKKEKHQIDFSLKKIKKKKKKFHEI